MFLFLQIGIYKKLNYFRKYLMINNFHYLSNQFEIRERPWMTSDVFWPFLTYLPNTMSDNFYPITSDILGLFLMDHSNKLYQHIVTICCSICPYFLFQEKNSENVKLLTPKTICISFLCCLQNSKDSIKVQILWGGHKILTKLLSLLSSVKTSGRLFQIFVAFSEKLNFIIWKYQIS